APPLAKDAPIPAESVLSMPAVTGMYDLADAADAAAPSSDAAAVETPPPAARAPIGKPIPAGVGRRLVSWLIDGAWIGALWYFAAGHFGGIDTPAGQQLGLFAALMMTAVICLIGWSIWGRTPGKLLTGLVVCADDGNHRLGLLRALLRVVGCALDLLTLGIGLLMALLGEHKALHDRVAGTYVGMPRRS
ncbi:MAG: RDD family protein, partial [Acidobacteriota bacterium]